MKNIQPGRRKDFKKVVAGAKAKIVFSSVASSVFFILFHGFYCFLGRKRVLFLFFSKSFINSHLKVSYKRFNADISIVFFYIPWHCYQYNYISKIIYFLLERIEAKCFLKPS